MRIEPIFRGRLRLSGAAVLDLGAGFGQRKENNVNCNTNTTATTDHTARGSWTFARWNITTVGVRIGAHIERNAVTFQVEEAPSGAWGFAILRP